MKQTNIDTFEDFVNPLNGLGSVNNVALASGLSGNNTTTLTPAPLANTTANTTANTAADTTLANNNTVAATTTAPAVVSGALPVAGGAADPISDLYTQYAGRAADPSGLAYWRQQFGDTVDPSEVATFQRAVADNVAKGVESTATATNYNPYFTANPDVAAEYLKNTQGMTPEQFAAYHYNTYGKNEGRAAPTGGTTTTSSPVEGVNTSPDALAAANAALSELV